MSYLLKTSNYTASAGDQIIAATAGGSFSILLPASPSAGDSVQIIDITRTFGDFPLTIDGNGKLISQQNGSITPTLVDSTNNDLVILVWATSGGIGGGSWLPYQFATLFNTR